MDKSYRELFFSESQEYLREINRSLVKLEENPNDVEIINLIFRVMHTLKGMAASMEYKELAEFSHKLEDAFDNFRQGGMKLTAETMDIVFESVDVLTTIIDDIKEERPVSVDLPAAFSRVDSILGKTAGKDSANPLPVKEAAIKIDKSYLEKLQQEYKNIYRIEAHLAKDCPMKGVRAYLILDRLKKIGQVVKTSPSEEALRSEAFDLSFEIIFASLSSDEEIKKELLKILEVESIEVGLFDQSSLEKFEKNDAAAATYLKKISSIRIPVERLDKIMNLTGELSISKSRLIQTIQNKDYDLLGETSYVIERLISSLQEEALKLRLLPVSYVLDNFPRVVRDLAHKLNKDVRLEIAGSEIEIDRVILDEIGELLIHIIRNSVDHGIEFPDDREKIGKSPQGVIAIKVSRDRGQIIIEVGDDGQGMDAKKIAKKAVEKGIITAEAATYIDNNKLLDILGTPGFSTQEEVTEFSGRGVGLDVVKNKLDNLGGNLDLQTELNQGTKITLTLPLTLAIIKAMLVVIDDHVYAIPLMNIRETLKIKKDEIKLIQDIEVIRLREEVIPIIRLDKELGLSLLSQKAEELSVVIVEGRARIMGFVVDRIIGEQDIVVKPLSSFAKKIKGITGATILGDGKVALILDAATLK